MSNRYTYPDSDVLVNLADIRDAQTLHDFERGRTALRHIELDVIPIKGNFDLEHLKAIHKHLFQDVYSWAGQLRTVNIGKNGFRAAIQGGGVRVGLVACTQEGVYGSGQRNRRSEKTR